MIKIDLQRKKLPFLEKVRDVVFNPVELFPTVLRQWFDWAC